MLVVYDNTPFKSYTAHSDVVQAMVGPKTVAVSFPTGTPAAPRVSPPFFGANRGRAFGSMAPGDVWADSGVDLLVDVGPKPSPWFPGGFVAELEALLHPRVDVATGRGIDVLVREQVLAEAVPL